MKKKLAYVLLFIIIVGSIICTLIAPKNINPINKLNIFSVNLSLFYVCQVIVFLAIAGLTLHLLLLLIKTLKRAIFRNKRKKYLCKEILKKEALLEKGKYVKVLQICEQYLHYYPNDEEILKFKQDLYIFTGNKPKKAELAYKKIKKLKLNKPGAMFNLSKRDIAKLKHLQNYHPLVKQYLVNLQKLEK